MQTIKEKLSHLNQLIQEGKALEGFELYYDDNVIMQENGLPPTVGKDANRQREIDFFTSITEFRQASVSDVVAGENLVYAKWNLDYTHKDWGVRKYTQISLQHWENGKIVKEQFFYGN
jgi:hypothetical protein